MTNPHEDPYAGTPLAADHLASGLIPDWQKIPVSAIDEMMELHQDAAEAVGRGLLGRVAAGMCARREACHDPFDEVGCPGLGVHLADARLVLTALGVAGMLPEVPR